MIYFSTGDHPHMASRDSDAPWPFADPPNVAVFTSWRILRGEDWVHCVTHDEEDGAWQFHPYSGWTPPNEAALVALSEILELDPSIGALADLPFGWYAWRDARHLPWQRMAMPAGSE